MNSLLTLLVMATLLAGPAHADQNDWPWWRGPDRNGHANPNQKLPAGLNAEQDTLWVTTIPGKGHGSPIVVGERLYLVTAEGKAQTQSLLCFDRKTGKPVWSKVVHKGSFPKKINGKATHASTSPACDGERLFVNFMNDGAVYTTAFDLAGTQLWQTRITDYIVHQGFGSSPAIYKDLVIVSADNKKGGAICGMRRSNGDIVWKVERPKMPNYVSPIICNIKGRDQMVFSGCEVVLSLDPATGKKLWERKGSTTETVTSIVTDGERVFISGGYPKNHVAAVEADGSGKVVWNNISRVYVPSMLVVDGHLYAVMDGGSAMCWDSKTGERKWKGVLGGTFTSSPVLVGDDIHVINENGEYSVFKANPAKFERIHKGALGEQVFATPVICGGRFYARVVESVNNERVEKLYCLGAK
ncbi:MAG: PQQ-binding-like beta-propeller repeat protein [Akkermansiaceae bacterium]|jgi:outer membrane protein assembly factor BamB